MVVRMAAGLVGGALLAGGVAVTVAVGAGAVGTALLVRRLCEERRGWREGATADAAPETVPLPDTP